MRASARRVSLIIYIRAMVAILNGNCMRLD